MSAILTTLHNSDGTTDIYPYTTNIPTDATPTSDSDNFMKSKDIYSAVHTVDVKADSAVDGVSVLSSVVSGISGTVDQHTTSISSLTISKITAPTSGSTGQYLQKTDSGVKWETVSAGVTDVNGVSGSVSVKVGTAVGVSSGSSVVISPAISDVTNLTTELGSKLVAPTTSGTSGQFLKTSGTGVVWASARISDVSGLISALSGKAAAPSFTSLTAVNSNITIGSAGAYGYTPTSGTTTTVVVGGIEAGAAAALRVNNSAGGIINFGSSVLSSTDTGIYLLTFINMVGTVEMLPKTTISE